MLEILNEEYFQIFMKEVIEFNSELIPLIEDYILELYNREDRGENKKINGMSLKTYGEKIRSKLVFYKKIEEGKYKIL